MLSRLRAAGMKKIGMNGGCQYPVDEAGSSVRGEGSMGMVVNMIRRFLRLERKPEIPPDFVLRRKARPRRERRERTAAQ